MLSSFNGHMLQAQIELSFARALGDHADIVTSCLATACRHVRCALAEANAMKDRKRAGLCLKALHWLRLAV
jgi:hypothetical protein